MKKTERLLIEAFNRNVTVWFVTVVMIISFICRFELRAFSSLDMRKYLLPWYDEIVQLGGFEALGYQVGNYGIPYQTIIAALTYLPVSAATGYKMVSCCFDVLLAAVSALIIKEVSVPSKNAPVIVFALVLMSPIVILNSAAWGQCDSIYTFFCLLTLLFFLKGKELWGIIAYGAAFAFKLQAIFLLPVIGFLYLKEKRFSISHLIIVPVEMIILSMGGLIRGRRIIDVFGVYAGQIEESKGALTKNYPGLWALLAPEANKSLDVVILPAVLIGLSLLGAFMFVLMIGTNNIGKKEWIIVSFFLVYLTVLVLPEMHERYSYVYEILALLVAAVDKRTIGGCVMLHLITMITYGNYLVGVVTDLRLLALLNTALFIAYLLYFMREYREMFGEENRAC